MWLGHVYRSWGCWLTERLREQSEMLSYCMDIHWTYNNRHGQSLVISSICRGKQGMV